MEAPLKRKAMTCRHSTGRNTPSAGEQKLKNETEQGGKRERGEPLAGKKH